MMEELFQTLFNEYIELKKDTKATWDSIKKHDGSVQHLEFLTDEQKDTLRQNGKKYAEKCCRKNVQIVSCLHTSEIANG